MAIDWKRLLIPQSPADFWPAAAAVASALAAVFAYRAVRVALKALGLEQTPILSLRRSGDNAIIVNEGRGLALDVLVIDGEGDYVISFSTLGAGKKVPVSRRLVSSGDAFDIFSRDIAGRWNRTRAVYKGLRWDDDSDFANNFRGRAYALSIPRKAKRRARTAGITALEYYRAATSYFSALGWSLRTERWWSLARIGIPRSLVRLPEWYRFRQLGRFDDELPAVHPQIQDRALWPVDVDGLVTCWKGAQLVRHVTCVTTEEGDVISNVVIAGLGSEPIRGLVIVKKSAFDALPQDREQRKDDIWRRFSRYLCRLRPKAPFVFSLRKIGPILLNWP